MTRAYCPQCLDVWCIEERRIVLRDWEKVPEGVRLHVSCGRALEAIRTAPPVVAATDDDFPPLPVGWAA